MIEPDSITATNNSVAVVFSTAQTGKCIVNGNSSVAAGPNTSQSFTGQTSVVINHTLGSSVLVACYDGSNKQVEPDSVTAANNQVTVAFTTAQTGRCVVNGSGASLPTQQVNSIVASPTNAMKRMIQKFAAASTIQAINCITDVDGSSTSVAITIQLRDANGANPVTVGTATCGNSNTAISSLSNTSITAGQWLSLTLGTVTGSPSSVAVTVSYTTP